MAEQFEYLKEKYKVILIHNPDYLIRNNNSSIYVAKNLFKKAAISVPPIITFSKIHLKLTLTPATIQQCT